MQKNVSEKMCVTKNVMKCVCHEKCLENSPGFHKSHLENRAVNSEAGARARVLKCTLTIFFGEVSIYKSTFRGTKYSNFLAAVTPVKSTFTPLPTRGEQRGELLPPGPLQTEEGFGESSRRPARPSPTGGECTSLHYVNVNTVS